MKLECIKEAPANFAAHQTCVTYIFYFRCLIGAPHLHNGAKPFDGLPFMTIRALLCTRRLCM